MDDYAMGGWWIPLPCTSPCPTTPVSSPSCRRRPPEHTGYTTISTTPFRNAYRAQLRSCQCWLRVDLRGVLQISVRSLAAHLLSPFHIPPSAAMAGFLPYVPACRVGAYRRTGWRGACQTPPKKMGEGDGGLRASQYKEKTQPDRISRNFRGSDAVPRSPKPLSVFPSASALCICPPPSAPVYSPSIRHGYLQQKTGMRWRRSDVKIGKSRAGMSSHRESTHPRRPPRARRRHGGYAHPPSVSHLTC